VSHGYVCPKCNVPCVITVTEQFVVGKRTVTITLCMRCYLAERKERAA